MKNKGYPLSMYNKYKKEQENQEKIQNSGLQYNSNKQCSPPKS